MSSIQYAEIIRSENENLNIIYNSKQEPLKTEISECVCCSEVKNTHNICMDCILKTSNIGKDKVYTEQQVREAIIRANPELMVEKCNEIINIINDK
jgi:ribosomal protein L32